jgi:hypothetical protein
LLNRRHLDLVLTGVDDALPVRHPNDERPSMSRVRYRAPGRNSWLSRRRVLAMAATGVGVSAAGVAGLSLAGTSDSKDDGAPLVISLRDVKKGTIDVFSGEKVKTITDKKLVASLLKAAGR